MLSMVEESVEVSQSRDEIAREKLLSIKSEEQRILSSWKMAQSTGHLIQKGIFYEAVNFVRMVASGDSSGCILLGAGGVGKSYTVTTVLSQDGVDYSYADSFSTPLGFYVWMFENRDKILVLDDVQGLFQDKRCISYLKSALWSPDGGARVVHNLSTKQPKDEFGELVPNHFEFSGGIIMLTNDIPMKNPHVQALLTRVNLAVINLTYAQKIEIMRDIVEQPYRDLSLDERLRCFGVVESRGRGIMRDVNFRTLIRLYQYFSFAKRRGDLSIFERLSDKLFRGVDDDFQVEVIRELESRVDLPTRKSKMVEALKILGISRATYFNRLAELGLTDSQQVAEGVGFDGVVS